MSLKKILYLSAGCLSLLFGAIGAVLPVLPTVPFLLLAAFCFARSFEKLHTWFIHTKLYKNNLETYVAGKGMTRKTKLRIMTTITLLMGAGFLLMHAVAVGRIVLVIIWVLHLLYFIFGVKTIPDAAAESTENCA